MSIKPGPDHTKPAIPEPPGDGFPPEKDVSTPPPDSDETEDRDEREQEDG